MTQKLSALFFLLIFSALITAPSIVMVIDDSVDMSCLYSINEEEEQGHETFSDNGKVFFYESLCILDGVKGNNKKTQYVYFNKTYLKPHLNLIFPPPEFIF